jgi:hypothetical protein
VEEGVDVAWIEGQVADKVATIVGVSKGLRVTKWLAGRLEEH